MIFQNSELLCDKLLMCQMIERGYNISVANFQSKTRESLWWIAGITSVFEMVTELVIVVILNFVLHFDCLQCC